MVLRILLALALGAGVASTAVAEEALPDELADVSILDRAGASLPKDVELTDQDGRRVTFGSYLADGKPTVLVLAYYRCPMLCSLVINGLTDGLKQLPWAAGDRFRVVVVSIDPAETSALAREKRQNYLREYGRPVSERGFEFLVGDAAGVRRLANAVGFRYRWDEPSKQWAHAAGAFVINPSGTLSRTLYGIVFPEKDLRLALVEAGEGKIGGAWDRVVLFCYHYDPSSRGYVLAATRLMTAGGAGTVLLLSVFLGRLWRREPKRLADGRVG